MSSGPRWMCAPPNWRSKAWKRRSAVLNRAAVGRGGGDGDGLPGLELVQRRGDVVLRRLHVLGVGRALVVDRAVVHELAAGIDDVHVRRGLRAVGPAHRAGLVHEVVRGRGAEIL